MSKLARFTQKLFGTSATGSRIAMFGSLAAGSPQAFSGATVTPDDVQALSNFQDGWDGAVIGNNSPPLQDDNALNYLAFYQLSYLFQQGIPEYDGSTTYYSNSLVMGSTGVLYQSVIDNNTGNSLTGSDWAVFTSSRKVPARTLLTLGSGTYVVPAGALYICVEMCAGGGGGANGNINGSTISSGGTGSNSSFGGSIGLCNGGTGGSSTGFGGVGGFATVNSPGVELLAVQGQDGQGRSQGVSDQSVPAGGCGGGTPFGPGAGGQKEDSTTAPHSHIFGGGGGGGAAPEVLTPGVTTESGAGGGGGGYCKFFIESPNLAGSYAYVIGAGGAGSTSANKGGDGAPGYAIVTAYFQ